MTPELAAEIQKALRLSTPPATYEEAVTLLLADNDAWEKLSLHQLCTENAELKAHLATATARVKWLEGGFTLIESLIRTGDTHSVKAEMVSWLAAEPQGGGE